MALHVHETDGEAEPLQVRPQFAQRGEISEVPKLRLAPDGMPAGTAYEIVHDELLLDGNARLNLATFVTTWMEHEAEQLMAECSAKNMIDKDEYPQTAELERRCVNILADLWHAPEDGGATGCSTTGSSEACMLGGLALKWRWRQRRQAAGEPVDRPNLVMGANVQVCWEKFCRYWDVEARLVPVGPEATCLTAEAAVAHCDENTIGVVAVLGSTYDGAYEPVAAIAAALDDLAGSGAVDVPIHVDGASGGFVAPFLDPELDVGLPPAPRPLHQRLGAQVRARVPGGRLGPVARPRRAPRGARLQRRLPRGADAHLRPQLLATGRPGRGPVLQLPPARPRGVPPGAAGVPGHRASGWSAQIGGLGPFELVSARRRHPRLRLPDRATRRTPSTTSPTPCGRRAGSSPPTRCPRPSTTWPCCGSWCATGSAATSPPCSSKTSSGSTTASAAATPGRAEVGFHH